MKKIITAALSVVLLVVMLGALIFPGEIPESERGVREATGHLVNCRTEEINAKNSWSERRIFIFEIDAITGRSFQFVAPKTFMARWKAECAKASSVVFNYTAQKTWYFDKNITYFVQALDFNEP